MLENPSPNAIPSGAPDQLRLALREQDVILETAGVGIVFIKQRTVIRCNQRFAQIYGHAEASDMLGRTSVSLYPDTESFYSLGKSAFTVMTQGLTYKSEVLMRRIDGSLFWSHLTGKLVNPADTAEGSIWIIDDIHEEKKAQERLQASLAEQNLILDNAMVGIVFLHDRHLTRSNGQFESMLGYAPGELKGFSSRAWYLSEQEWLDAGTRCYAPMAAGKTFEDEMVLRKKDGSPVHCAVNAKAIDPHDLSKGSIWIVLDVNARKKAELALEDARDSLEKLVESRTQELSRTVAELEQRAIEQKAAEAKIQQLAHFDPLTGLPNRLLLKDRCVQALSLADRGQRSVALMFIDLDHFKNINDSLGHHVGDEVLVQLAQRLKANVRDQDTVARFGGDEFILLLPNADMLGAAHVADKLLQSAMKPLHIGQHDLTVTPSIGIAIYPKDGADLDTLYKCADAAMYRAKEEGRNSYRFFTSELQAVSDRTLMLDNALRRALERDQLTLQYQPQIDIKTNRVIGAEALLRWHHPELGPVSPAEFIPIAESNGHILSIGEWVVRTAVNQLALWLKGGMQALTMSVNLSAIQFRHAELPELVSRILSDAGLPPELLELELTEGVAMNNPQKAIAVMDDLHQRGVRLSIDDFGTGYSSLSYLKRFKVYKLKIDQTFVRYITTDPDDKAIVGAIISLASSMGMQTIAEGVETEGQLEFLRSEGCDEVQGYYFSRPLTPSAFESFVSGRCGQSDTSQT
ncbi:EAL domain-containing protein [Rhodoferax sp. PAMC 29310]|uniref:sensor domain-containing protein n=1 Tax=Rhodoferax sp. PAMC 29310 TaxID=2822760 RepID=UPI001B33ED41|nr:EAL domain-containing protein [Rhodoferax sp. PAMC 29310]